MGVGKEGVRRLQHTRYIHDTQCIYQVRITIYWYKVRHVGRGEAERERRKKADLLPPNHNNRDETDTLLQLLLLYNV